MGFGLNVENRDQTKFISAPFLTRWSIYFRSLLVQEQYDVTKLKRSKVRQTDEL